ncbi:MAG: hypothetical protein ACKVVP_10795 [Chloroflexota bacterium]
MAQTAQVCGRTANVPTINLGEPGAAGITREEKLESPGAERAFQFTVSTASAAFVYVGDQWYDLDLAVWSVQENRSLACWVTVGAKAASQRSERRVLQLVRPDEQIIESLPPGDYILLAGADQQFVENPGTLRGFDPSRAFTIRVATTPLICGLSPVNVPHPNYPEVKMRADEALYQVAMNYQPNPPTTSSLMTFNVSASPPYNDLFDFQWFVNGAPVPGATDLTFQIPATQVAGPGRPGQVSVSARGARVYPDPDQPHVPLDGGTLTVACPIVLR